LAIEIENHGLTVVLRVVQRMVGSGELGVGGAGVRLHHPPHGGRRTPLHPVLPGTPQTNCFLY